ncbi:MAG: SRPBCC domain-containing protein [Caulobacteraceae bacterium]
MRIQIEHRIGVQVPATEAWRHLSDLESWGRWSAMYPKASGKLQIGAPLSLTEIIPGDEPQYLNAQVVDWVPNAQIIWTLKAGRFLRRIRYFELQTLTDDGCVFSNGEIYEGFGARFVSKDLKRALRQGFTDMGEAFKVMAERGAEAPVVAAVR